MAPGMLSAAFQSFSDTDSYSVLAGMSDARFGLAGKVWEHEYSRHGVFHWKGVSAAFAVDDDPEWRRQIAAEIGRDDWCGWLNVAAGVLPEKIPPNDLGEFGDIDPIQIFIKLPFESWCSLRETCRAAFAAGHGVLGAFKFWWPDKSGSRIYNPLETLDVSAKAAHPIFSLSLSRWAALPQRSDET